MLETCQSLSTRITNFESVCEQFITTEDIISEYMWSLNEHLPSQFHDIGYIHTPGWKDSCRAHAACNEIAHSREIRLCMQFSHPCHAILRSRHAWHSTLTYHTYFTVYLTFFALGNATFNTKNSMFVTPVSACVVCAIVTCTGVGIMRNFRVVWCANIGISHEY